MIVLKKRCRFLKISDAAKRDAIVKEYLELKKNIRDNLLSERTGELELQTDLSKFYRPITETQKATAREITEGLKPIREGIEKLPQAMQPIREATGEVSGKEVSLDFGEIAKEYLNTPTHSRDTTFGTREKQGLYYIGDKQATIFRNNIIIDNEKIEGTPGLWELIMVKTPVGYKEKDYSNYKRLMIKTNSLHRFYDPKNPYPKSSDSFKWTNILSPIWYGRKKYEGEGVVVIPSDPNAKDLIFNLQVKKRVIRVSETSW